jgi:DNA-binding CsgD family transcriptional regulator
MVSVLRDCDQFVGILSIARSSLMKPWSKADIDFMRAAATHVAHGFKSAKQVAQSWSPSDDFISFERSPQAVILMGMDGHVLALNDSARSIFGQIGVFDRVPLDAFAAEQIKTGLSYITRILRSIFFDQRDLSFELHAPVVRVYAHRSGIILKIRGFLTDGDPDHRFFTVIAEQGETEAHRQQRLMYRFGLSRRETDLLLRLTRVPQTGELAAAMGVSRETLKTYFKRLAEKLELHGRTELTKFALDHISKTDLMAAIKQST